MRAFWQRFPALGYALSAAIGVFAALHSIYLLFLLFLLLNRKPAIFLIGIATFLSVTLRYDLPTEEVSSEGRFSITSLTHHTSGHTDHWRYQGTLRNFGRHRSVPTTLTLPDHLNRPLANQDYIIKGTLLPDRFLISKEDPWIPVKGTFSLAQLRFEAKEWLAALIQKNVSHNDSAAFLIGVSTGTFDDPMLQHDFSRFGLQHIMAISGFHFSLIAAFLTLLLQLFLPQRLTLLTLLGLMTSYFLFLGPGPSVLRAFGTMGISLASTLLGRPTSGINALGFACLFLIAYDPLLLTTIGFPFSALTTAAILLFYPRFDEMLQKIFSGRSLVDTLSFPPLEQAAIYLVQVVRQSLAIALAVNVLAVPLTLYYFDRFPVLSLLYNLFFPFLVSISMMLLLASLIFPFLFPLVDHYTHALLAFTSNLPASYDINFKIASVTSAAMVLILFALLYLAISLDKKPAILQNYQSLKWRS